MIHLWYFLTEDPEQTLEYYCEVRIPTKHQNCIHPHIGNRWLTYENYDCTCHARRTADRLPPG